MWSESQIALNYDFCLGKWFCYEAENPYFRMNLFC